MPDRISKTAKMVNAVRYYESLGGNARTGFPNYARQLLQCAVGPSQMDFESK
jgi:hypothetical protein